MHTANFPAILALRPALKKGQTVGQKRPLKLKHVWAIRVRHELAEDRRDLALFGLAIDSNMRGCNLVRMKLIDVMASGQVLRCSVTKTAFRHVVQHFNWTERSTAGQSHRSYWE